jgi:mRNA interferase RelE/StbE
MRYSVYTIEWNRSARKQFEGIKDEALKRHILDVLEIEISRDPLAGKPLSGPFAGVRSYRIGVIRILYKFYKDRLVVVVLSIEHRRNVYHGR